jgi:hypothetical protein
MTLPPSCYPPHVRSSYCADKYQNVECDHVPPTSYP